MRRFFYAPNFPFSRRITSYPDTNNQQPKAGNQQPKKDVFPLKKQVFSLYFFSSR
jgi:hypothetical protein